MTQPLSALDAELTDLVAGGPSELTRNQQHAARALADECPWCGKTDCDDRWQHERWDAASETTIRQRWAS